MASPSASAGVIANGHTATSPPAEAAATTTTAASNANATTTEASAPKEDPEVLATSLDDDGLSRRPRDVRLLHLVLSSLGSHAYQERVPLQLLDFAYRYTSSVLSDSLRLVSEGYTAQDTKTSGRSKGNAAAGEDSGFTVTALRQAIASRQGHAFQTRLPKEFLLEQADERNRIALPKIERSYGLQLPPEKYCLTGTGWNLKDEWDSDEDVDEAVAVRQQQNGIHGDDAAMGGMGGDDDHEGEDEDEEGAGRMEDVFGAEAGDEDKMDQD